MFCHEAMALNKEQDRATLKWHQRKKPKNHVKLCSLRYCNQRILRFCRGKLTSNNWAREGDVTVTFVLAVQIENGNSWETSGSQVTVYCRYFGDERLKKRSLTKSVSLVDSLPISDCPSCFIALEVCLNARLPKTSKREKIWSRGSQGSF